MNIICCGRREEGKTTLAIFLARQRHSGVIVFDPRSMVSGLSVYGVDDLEEVIKDGLWRNRIISYRFEGDAETELSELCDFLFPPRFTKGAFALVVDEAGLRDIQTANSISPALDRAVRQHPTRPPEYAVTIVQTSHRLADFNGASKSLIDELFIFQTTSPRDLIALEEHTHSTGLVEIVQTLPKHHCIRYKYARQDGDAEQWELWDDPNMWDIHVTTDSATELSQEELSDA